MRVTREKGRRREPYPPTTVSFATNPSRAGRSTRSTRMDTAQCTGEPRPQGTRRERIAIGGGAGALGGYDIEATAEQMGRLRKGNAVAEQVAHGRYRFAAFHRRR